MYGKSWGGFNGLQMAYLNPPQLKAVISLYSLHDRYALDSHHDGGCLTGDALISWASYMLGWNARAPDPRVTKDWKKVWLERLHAMSGLHLRFPIVHLHVHRVLTTWKYISEPWAVEWIKHELRDDFWKHGSICEDYSRIKCPIFAIGSCRCP